jgi:hypothetical protein
MKEIRLLNDEIALVDDEDYGLVSQYQWHLHSEGYAVVTKAKPGGRQVIWMHRLVLGTACDVDHKDGNKLNNQKSNLRLATDSQNGGNRKINRKGHKTSRFKGVCWHKEDQRWRTTIKAKCAGVNRQIYVGQFIDETAAAKTYNRKAIELFGEFAKLNPV